MKNLTINWKTTAAGVLAILPAVASFFGVGHMDQSTAIATIVGGIGLIFAKDGNVTGGTKQQ